MEKAFRNSRGKCQANSLLSVTIRTSSEENVLQYSRMPKACATAQQDRAGTSLHSSAFTPAEKDRVMETCLHAACTVPMQIMEACCGVIDLATVFAEKGSRLAVSDAGVSAVLAGAALEGASLNVFINTKSMKDRVTAAALEAKANGMLDVYTVRAAEVFRAVREAL
jgi:hypothetical protein